MSKLEWRATIVMAAIFSLRMLGLFMILPVFAPFAHGLPGATPTMIGMALGIYGLTQASLQIPFGLLSDRIGRKPVITAGLLLFAFGSVVAAMAHSLPMIIVGRALQGAGAIGSTLMATVADFTQEQHRTRAMALIGMTIGLSFAAAMVLGPVLDHWVGVSGIFWLTSGLAMLGIIVLFVALPAPVKATTHRATSTIPGLLAEVVRDKQLLRLDLGIFFQHTILTATFIVIPMQLAQVAHLAAGKQWLFYLPILALSFMAMVPLIIIGEKKQKLKTIFILAISMTMLAQAALALWHSNLTELVVFLFLYFTGFNLLEASLPSLVSKFAPVDSKGTALGIYSTAQFLGIFVGGSFGGFIYGEYGSQGVLLSSAIAAFLWLLIASKMADPQEKTFKG